MIQKIVDTLVNKQLQNYEIADEDEKIYRYGYVLLCEVFLNLVIALVIGIVFLKTKEVIFFSCYVYSIKEFLWRMACR